MRLTELIEAEIGKCEHPDKVRPEDIAQSVIDCMNRDSTLTTVILFKRKRAKLVAKSSVIPSVVQEIVARMVRTEIGTWLEHDVN